MVSQRCFSLEPREKSHGQVDEATLPLCVMVRKLHVFPSEKGKKHHFCLPSVGNSSARISKVGLEKSTLKKKMCSKFFPRSSELFPRIPKGFKAPRRGLPSKGFVTLAVHPSTWEVATLENEFLGILSVFLVLFCCDGTWNACQKA